MASGPWFRFAARRQHSKVAAVVTNTVVTNFSPFAVVVAVASVGC
jgi:hypothetical protein